MAGPLLTLGVDFGTDSVRALVVDTTNGEEMSLGVAHYPRWKEGLYCDPLANQFRQHPLDYVESFTSAVKAAISQLPPGAPERIVGIGIDTTGSTVCPADEHGMPLALDERFASVPDAMFILWKDHTAVEEAEEINHKAKTWGGADFTSYSGGSYSAEWFWSKILHVLRRNADVASAAHSWVEHCDWMPALLVGAESPREIRRSRCAAGHKAMWHAIWNGLPARAFLEQVDPALGALRDRLYADTFTSDRMAGQLTAEWAARLGLQPGIAVSVGSIDAHAGAVGGGVDEGIMVKIMGTSTCDIMVTREETLGGRVVAGICGQVDGSVLPGMIGMEAGQSAYGDIFAWFRDLLVWPVRSLLPTLSCLSRKEHERVLSQLEDALLDALSEQVANTDDSTSLIALDWLNGRRTPYADQRLKGAIVGLTLSSTPTQIFRTLVEATAYGARAIVDTFQSQGVKVDQVIALGGIPKKNDFIMQATSDALGMPISVATSEQCCALGSAMFGAVAAGAWKTVPEAQKNIGSGFSRTFRPRAERAATYRDGYKAYKELGNALTPLLRVV